MTIDEVIQLGEKTKEDWSVLSGHPSWIWTMLLIGIILIAIAALELLDDDLDSTLIGFGIIFLFIGLISFGFTITDADEKKVDKWKDEVATPYIKSLPNENKEILYIKIHPDDYVTNLANDIFYINGKDEDRTRMTISYKDDEKVITKTYSMDIDMDLENTEAPYIEFKIVKKDLGFELDKGIYNPIIHLPKDYKFTEIK